MSFTLETTPRGVDLVVTGDWTAEAEAALTEGAADGLVLNYARGYRERDLGFLVGLPVRRLDILARTVKDLTAVYSLADTLVSLRVQTDPGALVELERLPLLTDLSASWSQVHGSLLFAKRLESLFLLSYTETDLAPMSELAALRSLVFKERPRVRSLDGVQGLTQLDELGVHLAKNLTDISAITGVAASLRTLQLPSCRLVTDLDAVASCRSLRFFELSDGGEVATIAALAGLDHLERLYLYGSTKVLDGDLSPVAALPRLTDFRMQSRRTYAPSVKEIQDAIARR